MQTLKIDAEYKNWYQEAGKFLVQERAYQKFPLETTKTRLYVFALYCPETKQIVCHKLSKTFETIKKIKQEAIEKNLDILYMPNPIQYNEKFFNTYREFYGKSNIFAKIEAINTDEKIYYIDYLVSDLDCDYEKNINNLTFILKELDIIDYCTIYKSASNRIKLYINIKEIKATTQIKNKKTILFFAKEIQKTLFLIFEKLNLNPDKTFKTKINHFLFLEEFRVLSKNSKKSELKLKAKNEINIFNLYNKIKKYQKEYRIYPQKKKENIRIDLVQEFLNKNKIITDSQLKQAIIKLAQKYKNNRFLNVILPSIGWGKYLGKELEAESILKELYPDKYKDIELATKIANPLKFKWHNNKKIRKQKHIHYSEIAIKLHQILVPGAKYSLRSLAKKIGSNPETIRVVVLTLYCICFEAKKFSDLDRKFKKKKFFVFL